jgi:hypothetical protein
MADKGESKTGFMVAAVAAAAVAGFVLYKTLSGGDSGKKSSKDKQPAADADKKVTEEEEEKEIPTFLFMDPELDQEEKESQIKEWVKNAVENLMSSNEDGKLPVSQMTMNEEDFTTVTTIVANRVKVALEESN